MPHEAPQPSSPQAFPAQSQVGLHELGKAPDGSAEDTVEQSYPVKSAVADQPQRLAGPGQPGSGEQVPHPNCTTSEAQRSSHSFKQHQSSSAQTQFAIAALQQPTSPSGDASQHD